MLQDSSCLECYVKRCYQQKNSKNSGIESQGHDRFCKYQNWLQQIYPRFKRSHAAR